MMDKETILKVAKHCSVNGKCACCPCFEDIEDCTKIFTRFIIETRKEPAPAATDTSSKENNLHDKYITSLKECQEAMFDLYANLDEIERRVWNAGESYGRICVLIDELDGKED